LLGKPFTFLLPDMAPKIVRLSSLPLRMRIGRKTVVLDSNTPLPQNILGIAIGMTDATFGRDHHDYFKSYIASGGIMGILERAGLTSNIVQRLICRHNCQQIVILARSKSIP